MSQMFWHNERTGEDEYRETPTDFSDYLPQSPAALNLYKLYQAHEGLDPIHAYVKVMEMACGVTPANTASTRTSGDAPASEKVDPL